VRHVYAALFFGNLNSRPSLQGWTTTKASSANDLKCTFVNFKERTESGDRDPSAVVSRF
jgi:hypothetical protein